MAITTICFVGLLAIGCSNTSDGAPAMGGQQGRASIRPLTVRQAIQRCAMHQGIGDNVVRVQGYFVDDMPPSSGGQDGALYGSRSVTSTTHSGGLRVVMSVRVKEKIGSMLNHSRVRVTGTIYCDQSPPWMGVHSFRLIHM